MNKKDKVLAIIESEDFNTYEGDDYYEFETWTDGGVNMIIQTGKDNISEDFIHYVDNFSPDDEVMVYMDVDSYKSNFTIRESLDDFEDFEYRLSQIKDQLLKL